MKRRLKAELIAKYFINCGQELFIDYAIKDKDFPCLKSDAKRQHLTSVSPILVCCPSSNLWAGICIVNYTITRQML